MFVVDSGRRNQLGIVSGEKCSSGILAELTKSQLLDMFYPYRICVVSVVLRLYVMVKL